MANTNFRNSTGDGGVEADVLVGTTGTITTVNTTKVNFGALATTLPVNKSIFTVTLAELNAGKTLIAAVAGTTIKVHDVIVRANGGAVEACTAVVIQDTHTSPVNVVSIPQATLTEGAVVRVDGTNVTRGAGLWANATAGKGIAIAKTGSAATTATSLTVILEWTATVA